MFNIQMNSIIPKEELNNKHLVNEPEYIEVYDQPHPVPMSSIIPTEAKLIENKETIIHTNNHYYQDYDFQITSPKLLEKLTKDYIFSRTLNYIESWFNLKDLNFNDIIDQILSSFPMELTQSEYKEIYKFVRIMTDSIIREVLPVFNSKNDVIAYRLVYFTDTSIVWGYTKDTTPKQPYVDAVITNPFINND